MMMTHMGVVGLEMFSWIVIGDKVACVMIPAASTLFLITFGEGRMIVTRLDQGYLGGRL